MTTLFSVILTLLITAAAQAAPITFNFAGVINNAPISGSYTFESMAPMNDSFHQAGGRVTAFGVAHIFSPAPLGLGQPIPSANSTMLSATINWNGQQGALDTTPLFDWEPRYGASGITALTGFYASTVHVQGLTGYDYFGLSVESVEPNPRALTAVPTVPPSLNGATPPVARLELFQHGTFTVVQGTLNSLTLVATPIPGAVLLFGSGLLALFAWRRYGSL